MTDLSNLSAAYSSYLMSHLAGTEETVLAQAYEIGREALNSGVGVLDFAKLHHDALRNVIVTDTPALRQVQIEQAADFFTEALSMFEMQLRGYRESISRLEKMNRDLKDAQVKMVENAKMASLGALVAGIAHEVNNPIGFSISHAATIQKILEQLGEAAGEMLGEEDAGRLTKAKQRVEQLRMGLDRVRDLVTKLRTFSRLDAGEFGGVDMRENIESVLTILNNRLKHGVTVATSYAEDNDLFCAAGPLNQVILNLVANALDSAGEEGELYIATWREDGWYVISIADNGPGVPPDLRDRIFEPFFTTKAVGSGTGLGLAITYKIVQRHFGQIEIRDRDGGGAEFVVRIPTDLEQRDLPDD